MARNGSGRRDPVGRDHPRACNSTRRTCGRTVDSVRKAGVFLVKRKQTQRSGVSGHDQHPAGVRSRGASPSAPAPRSGCGALVAWLLPTALTSGAGTFDAALVRLCAGLGGRRRRLALAGDRASPCWPPCAGASAYAAGVPAPAAPRRPRGLRGRARRRPGGAGPAHATPGSRTRTGSRGAAVRRRRAPAARPGHGAPPRRPRRSWSPRRHASGRSPPRGSAPGASDAEIDARWRRLYDLNRAEIGPDPDLIQPAQRLEVLP